jgi:hypothetical protein
MCSTRPQAEGQHWPKRNQAAYADPSFLQLVQVEIEAPLEQYDRYCQLHEGSQQAPEVLARMEHACNWTEQQARGFQNTNRRYPVAPGKPLRSYTRTGDNDD